jgi:hypothetical protein
MLLGIHIKLNDTNLYSKPFIFNQNNGSFIAQMIRDIDFSFLIKKNQEFLLNIIQYEHKNSYYELNKMNKEPSNSKIFGRYNLIFDEVLDNSCMNDFEKGVFKKILDENHDITLIFSVVRRKDEDDYIFSTPSIIGNSSFLE